ncbi:hypothetical protein ASPCAL09751 [Aspergillus calidoustus]|uniref:Trichothecene 3-O-acetyltransferase-like N-terminal domain-containing protein n=1 Tax=Aspergillus calidoustus TaxID=454130 RepID=A0A0U5G3H8_ASPCI|nr:hypothetical protein ASPCAL09751 [Aspergillus calidoustus]
MSFQDILGQLPLLKSYTHILLCFSLPDSHRAAALVSLQSATNRLVAAFPFLAGHVVHGGIAPGNSGAFTVEYDADNLPGHSILTVKDISGLMPPYRTLSAARASPSMLPGDIVAGPRPAFPKSYTDDEPAPVLEIQVSLLHGGLLLDIAAQHNIIDATGIFYIANLLSKLINTENTNPVPQADLVLGNRDRRDIIPLLPDNEPFPKDLDLDIYTGPRPPPINPDILSEFKWYLLHFTPESISSIHAEANSTPPDFVRGIPSVSVNDALTAFTWQCLTRARCALYPDFSTTTTTNSAGEAAEPTTQLTRAADLRRAMALTTAYMGHMVRTSNTRLPVRIVTASSLAYISSCLRATLRRDTSPRAVRAYATLLARTEDKSRILYAGGFDPLRDLSCSSVAHVSIPRFGQLGEVEFVRRPTTGVLPGGMYVGPAVGERGEPGGGRGGGNGYRGADAAVCWRVAEMEWLRGDDGWSKRVGVFE